MINQTIDNKLSVRRLIPEININNIQLITINNVCPKSGCIINKIAIEEVIKKVTKNLRVKLEI
jgi:hypothetical protein